MPFCRKCGRRLVEYSEVCTDCGTSTTAPIINTKRVQSSHLFRAGKDAKIAKAIIPQVSPIQIKVITDKPAKMAAPVRTVFAVQAVIKPKAAAAVKATTPIKFTPVKAVEPPKPVISAKHIAKPKKISPLKPAAAFTIAHARPVAGPNIAQRKPVLAPKPVTQPKPVVAEKDVVQPKPVVQPTPLVQPTPVAQPKPVAVFAKPVTQPKPTPPSKPITPAPVYEDHEIIKSNVSLKEDIIVNLQDYEKETFGFDLKCTHGHFWPAGKALPVSNGIAFCLKCGERLRKPKSKRKSSQRYHRF